MFAGSGDRTVPTDVPSRRPLVHGGGSHLVQFYESESFLVDCVRDFISPGLTAGEAVILICTADHLVRFEEALRQLGVDLDRARADGRYVALDAQRTLDSFMVDGTPDRQRFFESIGGALDELTPGNRRISAFGEMVALLWDQGAIPAAIRLEELWNELAETRSFTLLCAYPVAGSDIARAERFAEVCERHTHVVPAESYTGIPEEERLRQVSLMQHRTASERNRRQELERDRAQLEEALQKSKDLERMRSEFMAMVVHDIRTPNAIVTGFLTLLRENWTQLPPERIDELLSRAIENTAHISGLVTDMLTAARIDSGEFTFKLSRFDLAEVIYRTVGPARDTNSSTFEVCLPPDLPAAFGDADRQHQVLNNLLSNAVKFSPSGSTVTVSVERDGDYLVVSVSDEGPGIAPADREKLFKRFSRLESPSRAAGTGLGLFISKVLVEGQGGTISVASTPGRGSTFTYTVPIAS